MPGFPCQRVRARAFVLLAFVLLGGCDGCGSAPSRLRAGGETPFVRCAAVDPPPARAWKVGDLSFAIEGRTLRIDGPPRPLRLAMGIGPAPSNASIRPALDAVKRDGVDLIVLLGGIGDDAAAAERTLETLSTSGLPVLVLPGGRDEYGVFAKAFDALPADAAPSVLDGRGLTEIRFRGAELLLASGAPNGRYARSDEACGISEEDLEARAAELGSSGDTFRVLVSWAAPSGGKLSRGFDGVEAGDPAIERFRTAVGATAVVHAFPATHAGRAVADGRGAEPDRFSRTMEVALSKVGGEPPSRADESRAPRGFLRLNLGPNGLALAPPSPPRRSEDQP